VGFNGSMPGPTIEITQGDRVRIFVKNGLPEPFSMHWHGLEVPIDMDGTPGISQEAIPPGGSFTYEFTIDQHGTVLLPLAHGDAGTDGPHRPVHRPAACRRHAAHRP
jgi:FtsP/CotA-like multicopper oxidase with cupredoxin domain